MPRGFGKKKKDVVQDRKIARIERAIKPEIKVANISAFANGVATQSTNAVIANALTGNAVIAQGTTGSTRVGDLIKVTGIEIRGFVQPYTAVAFFQWCRFMLVQDNRHNGTALTGLELLTAYSVVDTSNNNVISPYNNDMVNTQFERGKQVNVLMDKRVHCNMIYLNTTGAADYQMKPFIWKKRFKVPLTVRYNGTNDKTGQLYLFVFPGSSTTNTNNPAHVWNAQVYFEDP